MSEYRVTLIGEAREVFVVEADSPEDARQRWHDGQSVLLEAYGMGVESVELED